MSMEAVPVQRPRLRTQIVHRPRLVGRLDGPLPKLVLFCAPAGFGKTTLALDWLRQADRPAAWLSLDAHDNDPARFAAKLDAAVRSLAPGGSGTGAESLRPPGHGAPGETAVARLLDAPADTGASGLIVLDDFHHIEEAAVHHAVRRLVESLGPNLHLLILTRVDPPLPLGKLRVSGDLLELREKDLRFTRDEAGALFRMARPDGLPEHLVDLLEERTEGWAAGLRMAALAIAGEADPEVVVTSFTGNHHFVMDYLLEEALDRQPEAVQRFLMRTSVLSRFDADLCAAVTEDPGAPRLLDSVEAANLFLVPLDGERRWFRYHHLFAELLEYRLRRLHPHEVEGLHARASAWLEAHGDEQEALRHASRIHAPGPFLALLDRCSFGMIARSELATLERWIRYAPEPTAHRYPMMLTSLAWLRLLTERRPALEPIVAAAEAALADPAVPYPPARTEEVRLLLDALRAYHLRFQNRVDEAITASEVVLQKLSDGHRLVRGALLFNLARAHMQRGDVRAAQPLLQRSFEENVAAGTDYLVLASLGHLGAVLLQTDGVARAREVLTGALAMAAERRMESLPACGIVLYHLGRVHYLADDLDRAQEVLERAIELGRGGHEPEILFNGLVQLARVRAAQRDFAAARALLSQAEMIGQVHNANPFDTTLECERARLALLGGEWQAAAELCAGFTSADTAGDQPWPPATESEVIVVLQLATQNGGAAHAVALTERLRRDAEPRGRGVALAAASIAGALLEPPGPARWERASAALQASVQRGYLRLWRDWGAPARALLRGVVEQPLPPESAAFVRVLLTRDATPADADRHPIPKFLQPLSSPLTEREQEVLFHLARGLSNKAIARSMSVSLETIKTHLKHIFAKLGASTRAEALERAAALGLCTAGERA